MDNDVISKAIADFKEHELSEHRERMAVLSTTCTIPNCILKGRPTAAKEEFIMRLHSVIPKLNGCTTFSDILDVCYDSFASIKGIGDLTITRFAEYAAFIRDVDMEASCYLAFLSKDAKKHLAAAGIIEENRLQLGSTKSYLEDLSYSEIITFLNSHYTLFS